MAKPKFAHIVFQTAKPQEMRDWYCTVLDAHIVYQDETLSFLTFDEEHHRVALLHPPIEFQRKTATTAALHHSAYTFDNIDDLLERYAMLRDKGITPAVCIAHGVTTSMYYQDPDRNVVELFYDTKYTEDQLAEFYAGGDRYVLSAIPFDPATKLEELRGGKTVAELTAWSAPAR